jgi:hypothetical protein
MESISSTEAKQDGTQLYDATHICLEDDVLCINIVL